MASNQPNQTVNGPSMRHDMSGCVVAAYDGHAQLLPFNTLTPNARLENKSTPDLLWADPDSTSGIGWNVGTSNPNALWAFVGAHD